MRLSPKACATMATWHCTGRSGAKLKPDVAYGDLGRDARERAILDMGAHIRYNGDPYEDDS